MLKLLSLSIVLAMALAGCGGSKTTNQAPAGSSEATSPAAPKVEMPTLEAVSAKVGGTDKVSLKHLPIFVSTFGKDHNLTVTFSEYSSGTKATQGLLNKEIDFGFLQVEHVLRDTSGELRIIALVTRYPGSALVVNTKYKDQIKSVKDLAGQKVGVSSLGAASHQFLLTLLAKNGVDAKSVNILPVGLDAPAVMAEDKVAAMVTIEPFITQAVEKGQVSLLVDSRKAEGTAEVYGENEWPWIALVTRKDVIESSPAVVERMTKAISTSLKSISSLSIDQIVALAPAEMHPGGDATLFTRILEANRVQFSPDGTLTQAMLEPIWKNMQELGAVPKDKALDFGSVVEARFH